MPAGMKMGAMTKALLAPEAMSSTAVPWAQLVLALVRAV